MTVAVGRQPILLALRWRLREHHAAKSKWICQGCRVGNRASTRRSYANVTTKPNYDYDEIQPPSLHRTNSLEAQNNAVVAPPNPDSDDPLKVEFSTALGELLRSKISQPYASRASKVRFDYGLSKALASKDGDGVLKALAVGHEDEAFLRKITRSTWTEILRLVDASKALPYYHTVHRSFNPRQLWQIGYDPSERRLAFENALLTSMKLRRSSGSLDIVDFQRFLRFAARTGNASVARRLWWDMQQWQIEPDLVCFNLYLEAIVWDESKRLSQASRAKRPRRKGITRMTDIALFEPGVSKEVTDIFNEMNRLGISGNTDTFCALMTALSRDGAIEEVSAILSNFWGVDIKAAEEADELSSPQITRSPSSPLYPNNRLLVTIADVYGAANRLPLAIRLVDFFSREYGVLVSKSVWFGISKWTWLHSRIRDEERLEPGSFTTDLDAVRQVTKTMRQKPYSVKLSSDQRDIDFRTTEKPQDAADPYAAVYKRLRLCRTEQWYYGQLRKKYLRALKALQTQNTTRGLRQLPSLPLNNLRRRVDHTRIRMNASRQLLVRWTARLINLLSYPSDASVAKPRDWQLRLLPNILRPKRLGNFAKRTISYGLGDSGRVVLELRTTAGSQDQRPERKPVAQDWEDVFTSIASGR